MLYRQSLRGKFVKKRRKEKEKERHRDRQKRDRQRFKGLFVTLDNSGKRAGMGGAYLCTYVQSK